LTYLFLGGVGGGDGALKFEEEDGGVVKEGLIREYGGE